MEENFINCGIRTVQIQYRVPISDICKKFGIKKGDAVEVYIRPVVTK